MAPKPPDAPAKGAASIMKKKIGPLPVPVAIVLVLAVGYLTYRHYKNSSASGTSGVSSSGSSAVDPNAVDPNTGLTYGAEEQAALGASNAAGPSTNGSGADGVGGGGLSVGDLEGLLAAVQGLGSTNYYYGGGGAGSSPTPTNPNGPGASTFAVVPPISYAPTPGGGSSIPNSGAAPGGGGNAASPGMTPAQIQEFGQYPSLSFTTPTPVTAGTVQAIPETSPGAVASASNPQGTYPTIQFGQPTVTKGTVQVSNPTITSNPTGGSANKKQGIYSTH